MKLSHRIFWGYFLIVAIAGLFLLKNVQDEFRPAVRQSMEETMVDTANLLAEIVKNDVHNGTIRTSEFASAVQGFLSRRFKTNIWGISKNTADYRIYITNYKGTVIFDSDNGKAIGEDFSQWNDVYLTLRGKYGARSTKSNPDDDNSSIMHIAAPIKHQNQIIGVLTVAKPNVSVLPFIQLSQRNILQASVLLLIVSSIFGWFISALLTRSTRKLVDYANAVREGKRAKLPKIQEYELSQLGQAVESMRKALEGKEYVEHYVHSLTHEIKSPLSGITGASELLTEEMDIKNRSRFIQNIKDDTSRIQNIVDRLLDLARLEQQQKLENTEALDVAKIVDDLLAAHTLQLDKKELQHNVEIEPCDKLFGDLFLINQAINNIIDNAIDFAPYGSTIDIKGALSHGHYKLVITDQGEGIPDYATHKVFERFYSLPRPQTGKKSSGLGLSFVKEAITLHGGEIAINSAPKGCEVVLMLPTR